MNRAPLILVPLALGALAGCGPSFDTAAPKITEGPIASVVRDTTITITWLTDERANSLVEYGTTDDFGTVEIDDHYLETHVITIKNLEPETQYFVRVASYDLFGNGPARKKFANPIETLDVQPLPEIVITEVMNSPVSSTTGEFIELLNNGLDDVDLVGFTITDGDISSPEPLQGFQGGSTLLAAGEYAVILDADYVDGTYDIPTGAVKLTTGDSTLGNALSLDDPISLFAPGQSVAASTYGTPSDSFDSVPLTTVETGKSVEIRDPNAEPADEAGNWCVSIDPSGSTPGNANSGC